MLAFWREQHGVGEEQAHELVQRGVDDGGVWTDPPVLRDRLAAMEEMLAPIPVAWQLQLIPDAFNKRTESIRATLDALVEALPNVDIIAMVDRTPRVLLRSPQLLRERLANLLSLGLRPDMDQVIGMAPQLIWVQPDDVSQRAAVIRRCYANASVAGWTRERCARMLLTNGAKLERLEYIDNKWGEVVRRNTADTAILKMKDHHFYDRFVKPKPRRRPVGRDGPPPPVPMHRTPLANVQPPMEGNVFAWARRLAAAKQRGVSEVQLSEVAIPTPADHSGRSYVSVAGPQLHRRELNKQAPPRPPNRAFAEPQLHWQTPASGGAHDDRDGLMLSSTGRLISPARYPMRDPEDTGKANVRSRGRRPSTAVWRGY